MLVSVIIPNYNHANFLEERIESVLHQSYDSFEVIILDDNSQDRSRDVIETYRSHPKLSKIVLNQENSGNPFKQWSKGMELAQGELIWIAESDDYADDSFLKKMVPFFENDTVALAYCQSYDVDTDGNILGSRVDYTRGFGEHRWQSDYTNSGVDEIRDYLVHKNTIPNASAVVFRKELFKWDDRLTNMKLLGDWLVWCQILRQGDIAFLSEHLNYFRASPHNTRRHDSFEKKKRRITEEFIVATSIDDILSKKEYKKKLADLLFKWIKMIVKYGRSSELLEVRKYIDEPNNLIYFKFYLYKLKRKISYFTS